MILHSDSSTSQVVPFIEKSLDRFGKTTTIDRGIIKLNSTSIDNEQQLLNFMKIKYCDCKFNKQNSSDLNEDKIEERCNTKHEDLNKIVRPTGMNKYLRKRSFSSPLREELNKSFARSQTIKSLINFSRNTNTRQTVENQRSWNSTCRRNSGKIAAIPKVAACCFTLTYLTVLVWANPMPPRLRSEHVARYINLTKTMGKEPLPSTFLTTTELIAARSLVPEEHYTITDDGYILSLYRLYNRKAMNSNKPPVLIMHGLMASSDSWIVGKRTTSLPLFLADMGYDVWLGDQRGNANSRRHVFLNPRSRAFWNFSFHENGYYDLPSFVDHILSRTGHKQLIYVGHSMATAAFLVMSTTKPHYNSKIKLSCLLAPVAYLRNVSELDFVLLQLLSQSELIIKSLEQVGLYEIFPRSTSLMQLTKLFCGSVITQPLCVLAIQLFLQQNPKNLDMERAGFIFSYVPAGSSLKMLEHFSHNMKSGQFQYYDYGTGANKNVYNSPQAPLYDLKKVTSPIALYYSLNDIFLNTRTVMKTVNELPNVAHVYEVPDKKYSHADFVLGLNSKDVLFKDLLKLLRKYE